MNRERFVELVTAEQEPLRRFLLALCSGDRMEAEEIAQEALVKAWVASGDYEERRRFRTWLFRIAYRTFLDHCKRLHTMPLEAAEEVAAPSGLEADSAFCYEALYAALGRLPEGMRASMLLYHIEGYNIAEIAAITHSNPMAVYQQLHRGMKRMREILKP